MIADRSGPALKETQELITSTFLKAKVVQRATDISKPEEVKALLDLAIDQFGRVDYACNAAGILGAPKRSHEMAIDEFDEMLSVNYRGCWLCSREELKHMVAQDPLPTHDGRPGNRG